MEIIRDMTIKADVVFYDTDHPRECVRARSDDEFLPDEAVLWDHIRAVYREMGMQPEILSAEVIKNRWTYPER